jgi:hypothetical protein
MDIAIEVSLVVDCECLRVMSLSLPYIDDIVGISSVYRYASIIDTSRYVGGTIYPPRQTFIEIYRCATGGDVLLVNSEDLYIVAALLYQFFDIWPFCHNIFYYCLQLPWWSFMYPQLDESMIHLYIFYTHTPVLLLASCASSIYSHHDVFTNTLFFWDITPTGWLYPNVIYCRYQILGELSDVVDYSVVLLALALDCHQIITHWIINRIVSYRLQIVERVAIVSLLKVAMMKWTVLVVVVSAIRFVSVLVDYCTARALLL